MQLFTASDAAIQTLAFGEVEAVVTDRFAVLTAVQTCPKAYLALGGQLWKEQIGVAVRKGNVSLQTALNGAPGTLLQSGQDAALSKKYFGQDVRC